MEELVLVGDPSKEDKKRKRRESKRSDEPGLVSELTSRVAISWTLGCRFPVWDARIPSAPQSNAPTPRISVASLTSSTDGTDGTDVVDELTNVE